MELPVNERTLNSDVLDLVAKTDLKELTSKFVRGFLEKKHNVALKPHKSTVDEMIKNSIKQCYPEGVGGPKVVPNTNGTVKKEPEPDPVSSKSKAHSDSDDSDDEPMPSTSKSDGSRSKTDGKFKSDEFIYDEVDKYERIKLRRAAQRKQTRRAPAKKEKTEGTKPKRKTVFSRICILSDELSEMLNTKYMTRAQVVSLMWKYFKEHELIDPKNKRYVIPDEKARAIFGAKKFLAFGMMKTLKTHIRDIEFLDDEGRTNALAEIKELTAAGLLDCNIPETEAKTTNKRKRASSIVESDSSDSEVEETPPKKSNQKKEEPKKAKATKKEVKQEVNANEPKTEARPKLLLKFSKKNEQMVSVSMNEDGKWQSKESSAKDNQPREPSTESSSTNDTAGPPTLQPEINEPAETVEQRRSPVSSSSSSSSGSSSDSSSSDSSSDSESEKENPKPKNNNDLQLSESDSD